MPGARGAHKPSKLPCEKAALTEGGARVVAQVPMPPLPPADLLQPGATPVRPAPLSLAPPWRPGRD